MSRRLTDQLPHLFRFPVAPEGQHVGRQRHSPLRKQLKGRPYRASYRPPQWHPHVAHAPAPRSRFEPAPLGAQLSVGATLSSYPRGASGSAQREGGRSPAPAGRKSQLAPASAARGAADARRPAPGADRSRHACVWHGLQRLARLEPTFRSPIPCGCDGLTGEGRAKQTPGREEPAKRPRGGTGEKDLPRILGDAR